MQQGPSERSGPEEMIYYSEAIRTSSVNRTGRAPWCGSHCCQVVLEPRPPHGCEARAHWQNTALPTDHKAPPSQVSRVI
ncbi:hypothetical protein EYF80_008039 [Liparis tanakae]|uniref:Uncharacterized protein n=1 Tax=Liparis tanakae TaxID=230148 RepID=A0A4Z2IWG4_9TELE|nr:hypothetical protein EYF80_008039 [Liparis tanakae]